MHRPTGLGRPRPFAGSSDRKVQATDFDALSSKYSAYLRGYLHDPFLDDMVQGVKASIGQTTARDAFTAKFPLINRGTYARYRAIEEILARFVLLEGDKQVVSLGAGSDTRVFSILKNVSDVVYHEIDFEASTRRKIAVICQNEDMKKIVGLNGQVLGPDLAELHTATYHLHPLDLKNITKFTPLLTGMSPESPTLVISECCLCYIDPDQSSYILEWLTSSISGSVAIVLYEPVTGNDSFGKVMLSNLVRRGMSRSSLAELPTIESHVNRLRDCGFSYSFGASISFIHDNWLGAPDLARIDKLEILDEREEMNLLLGHYCIVWGSRTDIPSLSELPYTIPSTTSLAV